MFYSREVLTSRKYGVATVWLVATLGSKSTLKKVSRKAILDVDVSKACETIGTPEAPLALRLQSNLLYGVTRVYAQQCGYVLNDVETAKNNMRLMFRVVQASSLDAEGGNKGRRVSDQLVLQDDPNFLPDFDLVPMDLEQFDLDLTAMEDSQRSTLSPHASQRTHAGIDLQDDFGGLIIPGSVSSLVGGPVGGLRGLGSLSVRDPSSAGRRDGARGFLDDDLGLEIDQDGNLLMSDGPVRQVQGPRVGSERLVGSASSRVRQEGGDGQQGEDNIVFGQSDDDGFLPLQDDESMLRAENEPIQPPAQAPTVQHVTSEETAEAPQRRRTQPTHKPIPLDHDTEVGNRELARWSANYIANQNEALRQKNASKAAAIAKRNAEYWILGGGDRGPLSMFSGRQLFEALTGVRLGAAGEKRAREDDEEADGGRRVRSRGEPSSDEIGRGQQEDDFMPVMGDDTIELGREAPTPLDDRQLSSMMPWNQSAGSRRPTALFSGAGQLTSASIGGPAGSLARRGSRLTSASPLMGRGVAGGDIDDFQLPGSQPDFMTGAEEFEPFGPAAQVDTQTAAQSQWQRAVLNGESLHFLEFVQSGIEELDQTRAQALAGNEEDESLQGTIDFSQLLPPDEHTCIVAAQALLHVLALGTKNLLSVQQTEAFGPITLEAISI
ncbi:R8 protein [Saxophila tyrrhenica]|uniref:R8 protein n=1 Tax=Saxophila tyrrhenica TaxID=1690608 RepID=A0AAV9PS15_9PEZI|nr:R8 protein [Saxophila tyrrhenica]